MKYCWYLPLIALLFGGCATGRAPLVKEMRDFTRPVRTQSFCVTEQTGFSHSITMPTMNCGDLDEIKRQIAGIQSKLNSGDFVTKDELAQALASLKAELAKVPGNSQEIARLRSWTESQIRRLNRTESIVRTALPGLEAKRVESFETDSAVLSTKQKKDLDKQILVLKTNKLTIVGIYTWADVRAGDSYNLALAQERAKATREYLKINGVKVAPNARVIGMGETKAFGLEYRPNRTIHLISKR